MKTAEFKFHPSEFLPFRDQAALERVRAIRRADFTKHPNKNFRIRVIEDQATFAFSYLMDIVAGIKRSLDEGRRHVVILPAPNPQYALVAQMLNQLRIPCHHVHTFNMDEYADEHGKTAPREWKGGFQYWMYHDLFDRIDPALRMPDSQIHFPSTKNVNDYSSMLEDLGGADVCYGGIGWAGHIAFFEPHLAKEFGEDIDAYLKAGSRIVELHPITQCQNSLFCDANCAGDIAACPPKAATIGPRDLKNSRLVSFWDGFTYGDVSWQRFITRLAAHGPVTPRVPASILQVLNSVLTVSGSVAEDYTTDIGERRTLIPSVRWGGELP
jgi:glucosamine-6-phosphate deaminase